MRASCVVIVMSLAVGAGCDGSGEPTDVSAQSAAVTAAERIVLTPWVSDAAAALPQTTQGEPLPEEPASPEYLARQQQYLEALKVKEQEWRALDHAEHEMTRLQGELKRSMLGE
jgi:hypothetical protein